MADTNEHADIKDMSFEQALKELEAIVDRLEKGDVDEALNAASQIGDDTLQKETQGYVVPDSFNHGTSAQRRHWFQTGYQSGKLSACDTFNNPI